METQRLRRSSVCSAGSTGRRRSDMALLMLLVLAGAGAARELDPAACAARFDVQRDKIIRTEESRDMGARYLAELDVGARQECLRLCCETDACDVFVYEEKSPGSCYLFACGPPEDFRCKFTAHGNFSSGVLAVARRRAEQQDRARLAQHEQALASLRSATSSTASTTTATTQPPPPSPTMPPAPQLPPPRRCSRYQFECHSGGECIAVYNACDGVPQCADGSDEAPELGCPAVPPPPATAPPDPPDPPRPQRLHHADTAQDVQDSSELSLARSGGGGGASAGGERWPHRLAQAQPHRYGAINTESGGGPHIFSHKGGLLQEPAEGAPAFLEPQPAWPRAPWPQPPPPSVMDSGWGGYARMDWPEPDPHRAWPVPQPRPEPDIPVYIPAKTMPELPLAYGGAGTGAGGGGAHTLRDAAKKGPPPAAAAPPPPAPPQPAAHIEVAPAAAAAHSATGAPATSGAAAASADIEVPRLTSAAHAHQHQHQHAPHFLSDERDGLSDHPPAAVLLLVLGVLMTAAMGVLAGCRARAARRRLRRGKSPFAHDADYLVNGMYL